MADAATIPEVDARWNGSPESPGVLLAYRTIRSQGESEARRLTRGFPRAGLTRAACQTNAPSPACGPGGYSIRQFPNRR